jgi:hypothetical protein
MRPELAMSVVYQVSNSVADPGLLGERRQGVRDEKGDGRFFLRNADGQDSSNESKLIVR